MQEHVKSVDSNSRAMFEEMQRMHGSLQASWQERCSLQSQLMQQQQQHGRNALLAWLP